MRTQDIILLIAINILLFAESIFTKIEIGCTWSPTSSPSSKWDNVKISSDGLNIVASSSKLGVPWIYSSANMGKHWGVHEVNSEHKIKSLAMSDDLKFILYADGHNSYYSESGGQIFKSISHPNAQAVAMSTDGSIQLSVNSTHLMRTTDDWKTASTTRFANGKAIALSSDGKKQIISNDHIFYKTTNYGKVFNDNWIGKFEGKKVNDIACNKDCSKIMIATEEGVYLTKNLVTWSIITGMEVSSKSIGMSDDSSVLVSTNDDLNFILGVKTSSKDPTLLLSDPDPSKKNKALKAVSASSNVIVAADQNNGKIYKCKFSNTLPPKRNKNTYHMLNVLEEEEYHTIPTTTSTSTFIPPPPIVIIFKVIRVNIPVFVTIVIVISLP